MRAYVAYVDIHRESPQLNKLDIGYSFDIILCMNPPYIHNWSSVSYIICHRQIKKTYNPGCLLMFKYCLANTPPLKRKYIFFTVCSESFHIHLQSLTRNSLFQWIHDLLVIYWSPVAATYHWKVLDLHSVNRYLKCYWKSIACNARWL